MKSKILKGHLQYARTVLQGCNELVKRVMDIKLERKESKWAKTTDKYLQLLQMKANDIRVKKKEYIDKDIKEWDAKQWTEEVNSKSSLQLYQAGKRHIKEDTTYDDTPESTILFQARTNSLPLEDRKRHSKEETSYRLCRTETENLEHFILNCKNLMNVRNNVRNLQRPHAENKLQIMRDFLFNNDMWEEDEEERKESLYSLWKARKEMLKRQ